MDDHQAGSLGVAGTTAAAAVDALGLGEGSTVLIIGASGGVGTFAVQLARRAGAHVLATAKPGDESLLTDLGAAETVDYTGDLVAAVRAAHPDGVDGLIDLVNRDHGAFAEMAGLVRDGGTASSAVGGAGEEHTIGGVSVVNVSGEAARLGSVADLVAEGALASRDHGDLPARGRGARARGVHQRPHARQTSDHDALTGFGVRRAW